MLGVSVKVEPTKWTHSKALEKIVSPVSYRFSWSYTVKCEYYHITLLEDITSKLAGTKYFSILDARSLYSQINQD